MFFSSTMQGNLFVIEWGSERKRMHPVMTVGERGLTRSVMTVIRSTDGHIGKWRDA
jgi:hypothetical protein